MKTRLQLDRGVVRVLAPMCRRTVELDVKTFITNSHRKPCSTTRKEPRLAMCAVYIALVTAATLWEIMAKVFFLPHMGLSRLSHQGGIFVVSGGGRVRGEDLNLSAILCTLCQ